MITIGKPYLDEKDGMIYLKASVSIPVEAAEAWIAFSHTAPSDWRLKEDYPPVAWSKPDFGMYFAVGKEHEEALCADRADAFLAAIIYYAMATGSDITCHAPVSQEILYGLRYELIPILCNEKTGFREIKIIAPVATEPYPNRGYVATGMSCGVDSMFTLKKHTQPEMLPKYQLSYLTYFNVGAIFQPMNTKRGCSLDEFNRELKRSCQEKLQLAKTVADESGLPILFVDTNIDTDFYRGGFIYTMTYRNCAAVLATQGYWSVYLSSSSGLTDEYNQPPSLREDPALFEKLVMDTFRTASCYLMESGAESNRMKKTESIADFPVANRHLDVCYYGNACGHCKKCQRTLLTLDIQHKLDAFQECMDIDRFRRERANAYGWLIRQKWFGKDRWELFDNAKKKKIINDKSFWYAICLSVTQIGYNLLHNIPGIMDSRFVKWVMKCLKQQA